MDDNGNVWLPVVGTPKHDISKALEGISLFKTFENGVSFNSAYSCMNLLINESELSGKINVKYEKTKQINLIKVCM